MSEAHLIPIIQPEGEEDLARYLRRAAEAYHWPQVRFDGDVAVLAELSMLVGDAEQARAVAARLVRALSFAAHSSMALRHLDRYVRSRGAGAAEELATLRDNSEHLYFLASLFSFSDYLSEVVIGHPVYLPEVMRSRGMSREKSFERYRDELAAWLANATTREERRERLVLYKKRELLRIGIRDLREMADTSELCRELSHLAQAITQTAYADCNAAAVARFGLPRSEEDGTVPGFCIYAMGKFGAGELNFSSDIDLVFVYDAEGQTEGVAELDGKRIRSTSNHEFFAWLARDISQYLNEHTAEGFMYRVDLRLRPEGASGPLARSRSAYAAYLASQAADWEKIAYIKARFIAGDASLASRFDPIIQLFVYTGNRIEELFPEVARLKRRIDFERLSEEGRELDIKRGTGGIREIEFIVAGLQVVHGEHLHELRIKPTLHAMGILVRLGLFDAALAATLTEAYHLYRRIEHTLQMMHESQTHRMPPPGLERERLALRCGFMLPDEFERTLASYRHTVRSEFERLFQDEAPRTEMTLADWLFSDAEPPAAIVAGLASAGLGDSGGFEALRRLAVGTAEFAPSAKGRAGFRRLLPSLLAELPAVALPRQAVHQFDLLLRAAHGFSWVYDICLENPMILRLLLRILGFGQLLGRMLIAHPEWLDELLHSDGLKEARTAGAIGRLERSGLSALPMEQGLRRLRQFKQLEGFLITVQEVLGIASSADGARRTTLLAEATLRQMVAIQTQKLTGSTAAPVRWAIIGLGGLGDGQVHVGGDLDLAFVAENGEHALLEQVDRICRAVISELPMLTPDGLLWKVDARLRPDGRSGPLVASEDRFEDYYRREAGLWEWQVLTKARAVAGDIEFGDAVLGRLRRLYSELGAPAGLAEEVRSMRTRIEESIRLPRTARHDLKRGPGGVIDIEFLVQYLQLVHPAEAETLFPLSTEQALQIFIDRGIVPAPEGSCLRTHLALLRGIQRHHRVLWETATDYWPEDTEQRAALRRGMADQLGPGVAQIDELDQGLAKARRIFDQLMATQGN